MASKLAAIVAAANALCPGDAVEHPHPHKKSIPQRMEDCRWRIYTATSSEDAMRAFEALCIAKFCDGHDMPMEVVCRTLPAIMMDTPDEKRLNAIPFPDDGKYACFCYTRGQAAEIARLLVGLAMQRFEEVA